MVCDAGKFLRVVRVQAIGGAVCGCALTARESKHVTAERQRRIALAVGCGCTHHVVPGEARCRGGVVGREHCHVVRAASDGVGSVAQHAASKPVHSATVCRVLEDVFEGRAHHAAHVGCARGDEFTEPVTVEQLTVGELACCAAADSVGEWCGARVLAVVGARGERVGQFTPEYVGTVVGERVF